MRRNLSQILSNAQAAGYYGKNTELQVTISNLNQLSTLDAMIRLEGSPFVDLAAVETAYPNDSALQPSNAEFVIIGTDLYSIKPIDTANATLVSGWTQFAIEKFADLNDISGVQANLNSFISSITSTVSSNASDAAAATATVASNLAAYQTSNDAALAAEVTRAEAAESTNANAIAAEVTRAEGVEADIISTLDAIVPQGGQMSQQ